MFAVVAIASVPGHGFLETSGAQRYDYPTISDALVAIVRRRDSLRRRGGRVLDYGVRDQRGRIVAWFMQGQVVAGLHEVPA